MSYVPFDCFSMPSSNNRLFKNPIGSSLKSSAVILIPPSLKVSRDEEPAVEGVFHFGQKIDGFRVECLAGRFGSSVLMKLTSLSFC